MCGTKGVDTSRVCVAKGTLDLTDGGKYPNAPKIGMPDIYVDRFEVSNNAWDGIKNDQRQAVLVKDTTTGSLIKILWEDDPELNSYKGVPGNIFVTLRNSQPSPVGFNDPEQPRVNVTGDEAALYCFMSDGRLPSPTERRWIASQRGQLQIPTPDGKWNPPNEKSGYNFGNILNVPRRVGEVTQGNDIKFAGESVYDLVGNVAEIVYDPKRHTHFIAGGSFATTGTNISELQADRFIPLTPGGKFNNVGFRCVYERPPRVDSSTTSAK